MRILIIEDDKDFRDILKASLEAESFVIDTANDGESGSYIARTNQYNLIITDYMLPKKNGEQMCREIRKAGIMTPILVMSVQSDSVEKVKLLEAGADDYICKPFAFTELVARIRTILRRPYTISNPTLTIDDLTIDTGAQEVFESGNKIYLTRKEYMLLECMTRKSGKVLTRAEIMEEVWEHDADPFSNTIEAHIRNLRKKIEKKKKYIHTVPGRGYKLDRVR
jgi:DNA-binding response OmpR family regulator